MLACVVGKEKCVCLEVFWQVLLPLCADQVKTQIEKIRVSRAVAG